MAKFFKGLVSVILSIIMVALCVVCVAGMLGIVAALFHTAAHDTVGLGRYDVSVAEDGGALTVVVSEEITSLNQLREGDTVVFYDVSTETRSRAMLPISSIQSDSFMVINLQGESCNIPSANLLGRVTYSYTLPTLVTNLASRLPGGIDYIWYWAGGIFLVICIALFFVCIALRRAVRRRQIRKELTAEHMMPKSDTTFDDLVTEEEPVELAELPEEEEMPHFTMEDMYEVTKQKRQEFAEQDSEESEE